MLEGLTTLSTYSSSPAGAWPETWTFATSLWMTVAPVRARRLMTPYTAVSLPGTSDDARMIVSSGSTAMCRWSPEAMRPRALMGSPCEPVDM